MATEQEEMGFGHGNDLLAPSGAVARVHATKLFIIFHDETAPKETYSAGRFL
jgi:uncharacterized protein (DUF1684 family)